MEALSEQGNRILISTIGVQLSYQGKAPFLPVPVCRGRGNDEYCPDRIAVGLVTGPHRVPREREDQQPFWRLET